MSSFEKYNSIIEKYINQRKLRSAIMLTAPWGTGKSYYIENTLSKHLSEKKIDILSESLYGISSIEELNNILILSYTSKMGEEFFEKHNNIKKIKELCDNFVGAHCIKDVKDTVVNKTGMFINGMIKSFHIKITEKDLSSIMKWHREISDKKILIILEDIERTKINIGELLGYVNNLVENNGMKVLLVVNEDELIRKTYDINVAEVSTEKNNQENQPDVDMAKNEYLLIKEKTVSNVIVFKPSLKDSINNILLDFDNEYKLTKNKFKNSSESVLSIMEINRSENLRTLIYALQKTIDFFDATINYRDNNFFDMVFSNILKLSIMEREGKANLFVDDANYVGSKRIKEYMNGEVLTAIQIDEIEKGYCNYLSECHKNSEAENLMGSIKNWYCYPQNEVERLIDSILNGVHNKVIKPNQYKNFMYFVLQAKKHVNNQNSIENLWELCLQNVDNKEFSISDFDNPNFSYDLFRNGSSADFEEYDRFKRELENKILEQKTNSSDFKFNSIDELLQSINDNQDKFENAFIANYDISKILDLLKAATPSQVLQFRTAILGNYKYVNSNDVYTNDMQSIKYMIDNFDNIIKSISDKVVIYNLNYLKGDLDRLYTQIQNITGNENDKKE